MLADRFAVGTRWITLILLPAVRRVLFRQLQHIVVAVGLRQNGCGGDGQKASVSLHHAGKGDLFVRSEPVAVYKKCLGLYLELFDGPVHGKERGFQNIDGINLGGCNHPYPPGDGLLFDKRT